MLMKNYLVILFTVNYLFYTIYFLAPRTQNLRARSHYFKLTVKNSSFSESNFITTMLFKDVY